VGAIAAVTGTFKAVICPSDTFYYFGTPMMAGDVSTFTLSSVVTGCDSVVTVTVSPLPTFASAFQAKVCPGSKFSYQGVDLAIGTVLDFVLSSVITGCDSTVTVTVGALPTFTSAFNAKTCPRTTYKYQGVDLAIGAVQDFVLSSVITGCDSTVTVTVSVLPEFTSAFVQKVCPGETFQYANKTLKAGDVQSFTLLSLVNGCDSVVTVTVKEKPTASDTLDVTVCPGTTYDFNGTKIAPGASQSFSFKGFEGCDSTVFVTVSAYPAADFDLNATASCPNTPTGQLEINNVTGGLTPYLYSLDGVSFQDSLNFDLLTPGNYTVYLQDGNDCLFEKDTLIESIPPLSVSLANAILPCDTSGVRLVPIIQPGQTNLTFKWWNGATTETITAIEPGLVWVEVRNACELKRQEANVNWADLDPEASFVYVPNVFSPSATRADNANFHPFFPSGVQLLEYRFEVFDRWGNLMFHSVQTNDGWEGNFKSKAFKPGVCAWYLVAKIAYCGQTIELKKKGDVTLME
jgi:hypothetical protein